MYISTKPNSNDLLMQYTHSLDGDRKAILQIMTFEIVAEIKKPERRKLSVQRYHYNECHIFIESVTSNLGNLLT